MLCLEAAISTSYHKNMHCSIMIEIAMNRPLTVVFGELRMLQQINRLFPIQVPVVKSLSKGSKFHCV